MRSSSVEFDPIKHLGKVLTGWGKYFLGTGKNAKDTEFFWKDIRNPDSSISNSILDSEILLCFLLPESRLRSFRFEGITKWEGEIEDHPLYSNLVTISDSERTYSYWNRKIKSAIDAYFARNSDANGKPTFASNSYLSQTGQKRIPKKPVETVDAFSFSLSASIAIRLLAERLISAHDGDSEEVEFWKSVAEKSSKRITGAMDGLLRSFAIEKLPIDEWQKTTGRTWPEESGGDQSQNFLSTTRVQLRGLEYELPMRLTFELGWSWGPIEPSQRLKVAEISEDEANADPALFAEAAPYLYFTMNALDGIADLASPELEAGSILTSDQLAMASRLKSLANMVSTYWLSLAIADDSRGGPGEWEIETIPFRTADAQGSVYWNLYLARVILSGIALKDSDLEKLANLAERLGEAGRVTTPPYPPETDPAVKEAHFPGLEIRLLSGGEKGHQVYGWSAYDFSPQLLKLASQVARQTEQSDVKQRMLGLSQRIWRHLFRRIGPGDGLHWDYFASVFGEGFDFWGAKDGKKSEVQINASKASVGWPMKEKGVNSWYMTERVVEALVAAAEAEQSRPRPSDTLRQLAMALFLEAQSNSADRSLDPEVQKATRTELDFCRRIIRDRPGEAAARLLTLLNQKGRDR